MRAVTPSHATWGRSSARRRRAVQRAGEKPDATGRSAFWRLSQRRERAGNSPL